MSAMREIETDYLVVGAGASGMAFVDALLSGADADGHHIRSLLTGADTIVRARKLVDATYVESDIPSRHTPSFMVDEDIKLIPPNDLVTLADVPRGFTVIGAGKTAMDTCNWL